MKNLSTQLVQSTMSLSDETEFPGSQPAVKKPEEHFSGEGSRTQNADVIASLCAFAPNTQIRDCLRLYQPGRTTIQLKVSINRKNKFVITSTLEYLGVYLNWNEHMKGDCVHRLLRRIKNLYPKQCEHCEQIYNVDKDDTPLLPCMRCGHDIHRKCLLHILKVENEDIAENCVKKLVNPYGILSLHHLCGDCEKYMITEDIVPKECDQHNKEENKENSQNSQRDTTGSINNENATPERLQGDERRDSVVSAVSEDVPQENNMVMVKTKKLPSVNITREVVANMAGRA